MSKRKLSTNEKVEIEQIDKHNEKDDHEHEHEHDDDNQNEMKIDFNQQFIGRQHQIQQLSNLFNLSTTTLGVIYGGKKKQKQKKTKKKHEKNNLTSKSKLLFTTYICRGQLLLR
jgi:hypothetical protein